MGGRACKLGHALLFRSAGQVRLGLPGASAASPALRPQPIRPGSGQAVPSWGIGRPFPGVRCAEANT